MGRKSLLPLGVLLLLVRRVPLYRLQVACWLEECHCQGDESRCCQHAEPGLSGTVVSWCTYPVVYLFPFLNLSGAQAVVGIQLGYCVSDVISKCGVGFLIYNITIQKSDALTKNALLA